MRIAILTVSDAGSRGERVDTSGDAIAAWAGSQGHQVAARTLVPDEAERIAATLTDWADRDEADLIITTGGTGVAPRDVTPEATSSVLQRDVPGIPESMRMMAIDTVPRAMLSRGVAGVRGRALIVNLPGSTGGVKDGLKVLGRVAEHAVALIRGEPTDHC